MSEHHYSITFRTSRGLNQEESSTLSKKLTNMFQRDPFGRWKPEKPDPPIATTPSLALEVDPLLGYDKTWLIAALIDHLTLQRVRIETGDATDSTLEDVKFSITRLDEFALETVPGLDDLREIVEKGLY